MLQPLLHVRGAAPQEGQDRGGEYWKDILSVFFLCGVVTGARDITQRPALEGKGSRDVSGEEGGQQDRGKNMGYLQPDYIEEDAAGAAKIEDQTLRIGGRR